MQLQKFHVRKDSNTIDAARQLVIVQVKLCQGTETEQFAGQAAGKLVEIKVEKDEVGQAGNLGRNGRTETTTFHAPDRQVVQETNLRRNSPDKVVFLCKQREQELVWDV